jgi:hypothetical protein
MLRKPFTPPSLYYRVRTFYVDSLVCERSWRENSHLVRQVPTTKIPCRYAKSIVRIYSIHLTIIFPHVQRFVYVFSVYTTTVPYNQSGYFSQCSLGTGACFMKLKTVSVLNSSSTECVWTQHVSIVCTGNIQTVPWVFEDLTVILPLDCTLSILILTQLKILPLQLTLSFLEAQISI